MASPTSTAIDYFVGNTLSIVPDSLCDQIHRGALFVGDELLPGFRREDAVELTRSFASQLPAVRGLLISDLRAAFVGDPAARNFPEILIGYPGMTAIIHHRLAPASAERATGRPADGGNRPCQDRHRHSSRGHDRIGLLY